MADSSESCKPSVSAARKARQNYAIAESFKEMSDMKSRMSKMEATIADLSSRLQELQPQSMPKLTIPPGLGNVQHDLAERVSLLEQVFVLVDWPALENSAKFYKPTEPDSELSPDSRSLDMIAESDKNLIISLTCQRSLLLHSRRSWEHRHGSRRIALQSTSIASKPSFRTQACRRRLAKSVVSAPHLQVAQRQKAACLIRKCLRIIDKLSSSRLLTS